MKDIRAIANWHPFLWCLAATFGLLIYGALAHPQYDDRSWGLVWLVVTYVVTMPYRAVLVPITGLLGFNTLSIAIGISLYAALMIAGDRMLVRRAKNGQLD